MPYLPVDLDAKRKALDIERALVLPRFAVLGGLIELWEGVWREKSDTVDELTLAAAFGPEERVRSALVAREFLEPLPDGRWRVRGAAKWLFGMEGQSRAGKARAASSRRDPAGRLLPNKPASIQPAGPAEPSRAGPASPALSPSTQHPASEDSKALPHAAGAGAPDEPAPMFSGLRVEAVAKGAKPEKRSKPRQPPANPRWVPFIAELTGAFLELTGTAYEFVGERDATALKALLGNHPEAEVMAFWRFGLQAKGYLHTANLGQLRTKWNDIAAAPGRHSSAHPEGELSKKFTANATQFDGFSENQF